jgi:hypothetical protein
VDPVDPDPDPQHCPLVDNIAGNASTHLSISLSLVFCKVGKFPFSRSNNAGNAITHVSISLSQVFCKVGKFPFSVGNIAGNASTHVSTSLSLVFCVKLGNFL